MCGKPKVNYVYIPMKRWQPVCENHLTQGLVGKSDNPQYDLYELLEAFKTQSRPASPQKAFALFLSTLFYADELQNGSKRRDVQKIKNIATKCKSSVGLVPPELLTHHILGLRA